MDASTVMTSDRSLLHAVRQVLSSPEEAFLYVAFVREKGIHLLRKELEAPRDPVSTTRGRQPRLNRALELTPVEALVETERSRSRVRGAESIPAWTFNLAWERLGTHGRLSSSELLNDLRVHRSSTVCAMLARLLQIERVPGKEIVLRWR